MQNVLEVSLLKDGTVMLLTNRDFSADLQHVEFYRDQKLFNFVCNDDEAGQLFEYEVTAFASDMVRKSPPNVIVVSQPGLKEDLKWWEVPLIQVGIL